MGKTTAEKIFEAHLVDEPFPGTKVLKLDAVLCHEITTPIAIDDLIRRGKDRVFDPARIKAVIDHDTPGKDTKTATQAKILRDWARRPSEGSHACTAARSATESGPGLTATANLTVVAPPTITKGFSPISRAAST